MLCALNKRGVQSSLWLLYFTFSIMVFKYMAIHDHYFGISVLYDPYCQGISVLLGLLVVGTVQALPVII